VFLREKFAKPEEVQKFKLATRITTFFIQHFGMRDLFGRENYEYYARLTGRILKVEDEWTFFTYPPVSFSSNEDIEANSLAANATASLSNEEMDRLAPPAQLIDKSGSLEIIPENCSLDPSGRLSISLDDKNVSSPSSCGSPIQTCRHTQSLSRPPTASRGHHEVKSYSCLPQWDINRRHSFTNRRMFSTANIANYNNFSKVHQRQTERMRHRSEWFLSDPTGMVTVKCRPSSVMMTPTCTTSPIPSGPPSLPCSRPPPLPSSQPPRPSTNATSGSVGGISGSGGGISGTSMGRLSPNVCDTSSKLSISSMATMSPLPKSGLSMASSKGMHETSATNDFAEHPHER